MEEEEEEEAEKKKCARSSRRHVYLQGGETHFHFQRRPTNQPHPHHRPTPDDPHLLPLVIAFQVPSCFAKGGASEDLLRAWRSLTDKQRRPGDSYLPGN